MVTLEVGIDARGVVQGSREAFAAMNQIVNSAHHVMAAMEALGSSGGGFAKFGAMLTRAQPWIMAVTAAMAGVNLAMGLFGDRTNEAADAWERLGSAAAKARMDQRTAEFLGIGTKGSVDAQRAQLEAGITQSWGGAPVSAGALQSASGGELMGIVRLLARQGDASAQEYMRTGRFDTGQRMGGRELGGEVVWSTDPSQLAVDPDVQRLVLAARWRSLGGAQTQTIPGAAYGASPDYGPPSPFGPEGPAAPSMYGPYTADDGSDAAMAARRGDEMWKAQAAAQREASEEALQNMRELQQAGAEFGATIADAFLAVAEGTMTARQAIASIVMDLSRSALRGAFANAGAAIAGSFASSGGAEAGGAGGYGGAGG